ncbi:hypothetical protein DFA_00269 [Cavenderia fasciculata]|uniref:Uncharacterized protein n=1 Tax=Cavenderia fasciculata TaxID=261658 RepID=F4PY31_CACFS|nr:uncharacterized protein DFA_00269 [Cavenderia fasciculata]EGG19691.1 hypothetical protein DFA_00269 [Cavenderia fasciculata]|eukprot:XP_004357985.1 hypothetical protein DFA_00269 [Cavenderia fasciculata]
MDDRVKTNCVEGFPYIDVRDMEFLFECFGVKEDGIEKSGCKNGCIQFVQAGEQGNRSVIAWLGLATVFMNGKDSSIPPSRRNRREINATIQESKNTPSGPGDVPFFKFKMAATSSANDISFVKS